MPTANRCERGGHRRPAPLCRQSSDPCPRPSRAAALRQVIRLAIGVSLFSNVALCAQRSASQTGDTNASWTVSTESQSDNVNPTRTLESHSQSGSRTLDKQSLQRRGSNGEFEFYQDVEKETVQVDVATVRTTTRTFGRDANGAKTLVQVTEEENHTLPAGGSNLVRATSNLDVNGNLQLVQRQIEETRSTSKDVEETKTTVMLPSVNGGLTPAMEVQERRKRGANDAIESQKTTLLLDGAGNWQVSEIRQSTTRPEGKNRSTEERVSRPDSEGNLSEVSRTVSHESENAPGEKRATVEIYSVDVAGSARDGSLHLVGRATTTERGSATGQQTRVQQIEQPNPGDPGSGLRATTLTIDTVRPGRSGAQGTRTIQARDANGGFGIVSVDTTKSDAVHPILVQIAPPGKPK
jgi:hypothetical protein